MDSYQKQHSKEDNLNDSWVELHFQQQPEQPLEQSVLLSKPTHGQLESLLLEAQKESRNSSQTSSRGGSKPESRESPKSPQSPNNEALTINVSSQDEDSLVNKVVGTDWVWDWSSRPEAIPPSDYNGKFKHPVRHKSALHSPKVDKRGPFSLKTLILTHACSFFVGGAVCTAAMLIYLKKVLNWGPLLVTTMALE